MKIIYIPVAKKIKEKNLKNYIKCFLYDVYIILHQIMSFQFNKFPSTEAGTLRVIIKPGG